jgi:hypothetical protein
MRAARAAVLQVVALRFRRRSRLLGKLEVPMRRAVNAEPRAGAHTTQLTPEVQVEVRFK